MSILYIGIDVSKDVSTKYVQNWSTKKNHNKYVLSMKRTEYGY